MVAALGVDGRIASLGNVQRSPQLDVAMGAESGASKRQSVTGVGVDPAGQWDQLPGAALQVLIEQLCINDFKNLRLVCISWMMAGRCRHLRLTLSCPEHEHLWQNDPAWLTHMLARGRLYLSQLRVEQVALGQPRPQRPDLLRLAQMIEQVPLSLQEVQLVLHPMAREGLDNSPPMDPAWVTCIARMARYTPTTSQLAPRQADEGQGQGQQQQQQQLQLQQPQQQQVAAGQRYACAVEVGSHLRRIKLDATALQQGYCGVPGSACLAVEVLQQLVAQVPSLSSLALSVRTASQDAAVQLAAMQLQVLRLQYDETLSPGVEPTAAGGATGAWAAAGAALAAGATLAAAAAAATAAAIVGLGHGAAAAHVQQSNHAFVSSFLAPLTGLQSLQHLAVSMSFPSFGPGASHFRRGSSPWLLQLLPSFPHLRQLELTLVMQDLTPLLCHRPIFAKLGGCRWAFGPSIFPPGTLRCLQQAVIRVRGYAAKEQVALCGQALEALAYELAALPALQHLTLGICTAQAVCAVPHRVWEALLQQPDRQHGRPASTRSAASCSAAGCSATPHHTHQPFTVALELSSESSRWGAFGLPNPLLHAGAREGLLLLPLEELLRQYELFTSFQQQQQQQQQQQRQWQRKQGDDTAACGSSKAASSSDASSNAVRLPALPSFPLTSFQVKRSPASGSVTSTLGHHHLLLLPHHLSLISRLQSLTELHVEFQAAVLEPYMAHLQVQAARPPSRCGQEPVWQGATAGISTMPRCTGGPQGKAGQAPARLHVASAGSSANMAPSCLEASLDSCGSSRLSSPGSSFSSQGTASCSSAGSGGASKGGGSGDSCLLWLTHLPLLRSLYLRAYGTQYVGAESVMYAPDRALSRSAGGAEPAADSDSEAGAEAAEVLLGPGQGAQVPDFLGEAIGSSFRELSVVGAPASGMRLALHSLLAAASRATMVADASWLRFDDRCAAAVAAAWGRQMTALQLIGIDMEGLTPSGMAVLEGMPLLQCLMLTKTPAVKPMAAGSRAAGVGAPLSRLPSLGVPPSGGHSK